MAKKLLVFLLAFMFMASLFSLPVEKAESAGENWLVGYNYRKSHVIENATGAGTNYQIKIVTYLGSGTDSGENVYLGGKARSDFADVRFTDDDGETLLDYWLEGTLDIDLYANVSSSSPPEADYYNDASLIPMLKASDSGWDDSHIVDFDVVNIGGTLWAIYGGVDEETSNVQIGLANSTDNGITWTKYENNPIITNGSVGTWEDERVYYMRFLKNETGDLIQVNGVYHIIYTGWGGSGTKFSYGLANSSDLKTWTKYEGNPIMTPDDATAEAWEDTQLICPLPWEEDGHYYMLYAGAHSSWYTDIGLANSSDLRTWTRRTADNPVLARGANGEWDDSGAWPGDMIKMSGYYYLGYSGQSASAVWHSGFAKSSNLISWTKRNTVTPATYGTKRDHIVFEEIQGVWGAFVSHTEGDEGNPCTMRGFIQNQIGETEKTIFWVEVADDLSTTDQTIYIYYGKSDASTTSNGDNTFLFFDHFPYGSLDSSKWDEVNSPTVTVQNSILTVTSATANWRGVRSDDAYGPLNIAWRSSKNFTESKYNLAGMQNASALADDSLIFYWTTTGENAKSANEGTQQTTVLSEDNETHVFEATWVSGTAEFYVDDVLRATHTTQVPNEALYCWIESYSTSQHTDWVSVRKFVSPSPNHGSWGAREDYGPPPYMFEFYGLYHEDSGLLYDASERAVNVTAYFVTGVNMTKTFEVNGTYSFQTNYQPLYFKFDLVNDREYWLGEDETSADIYIFNVTSTVYTIDFIDLAGALNDYPFVSAKRYVNGTAHIIEKRKVDVEKKIIMALKNGEKYTITIQDGSSYEYGDLLITSETSITLTLKGIEFPQNVILAYRYVRLYAERHNNHTSISMLYQDLQTNTDNVTCSINYRNGTSAYSSTQYTNTFNVTWTSANENITYFVAMDAMHGDYGEINYRATLYRSQMGTNPFDQLGNIIGTIPGISTADIIPTVVIVAVAAVFSKVNAYVGGFMAIIFAMFLTWYGWISIPMAMIVTALFIVIIAGLVAHKARSGT